MQFLRNQNDTVIGNYRISKTIGEGTFGKVKLGIHQPTGEKVAIKILEKEKIVQNADMERISREICILKLLRHPNIIQLYEILETKRNIYLIMEYAEGGELFNYIVKKKRIEQLQAVTFMQQILSGVEYLHQNFIAHRDLKPQNLLLDYKKNIKIVDFGLSNQYKPGDKLSTACGSPCYAAPQMIAGKDYFGPNVDIWSCGIIMYALLCGYLPFEDPNTNKLYKKIINGQYEVPKVLTKQSQELLRCVLNTDFERRYNIDQIRESKWYNLVTDCTLNNKGIIVGRDKMQINYEVISQLQQYNVDGHQAIEYLQNNRHNSVTSIYYLLLKKFQRSTKSSDNMIYRPAKQDNKTKLYQFMAKKKQKKIIDEMNQSLNFEQIKNALMHKKQMTPTARLDFDPKIKHSYNHQSITNGNNEYLANSQNSEGRNLAQSLWVPGSKKAPKIESNTNTNFYQKPRSKIDSDITSNYLYELKNFSKYTSRKPIIKDGINSINNSISYNLSSPQQKTKSLPLHNGPFNSKSLFQQNPQNLFRNIVQFLNKESISFKIDNAHTEKYTIKIGSDLKIWIETLEQTSGVHLVLFDHKSSLNERILNYLEAN